MKALARPIPAIVLDPFHPTRRQVGCGAQARHFLEHLVSDVRDLEGIGRAVRADSADSEQFPADLPDMGAPPLNDMGRRFQAGTKNVEFRDRHSI